MQTKTSHITIVLLSAVVFVKATTSAAEARSPRGWVNHHLGGIEKEITHAEKSLVSGWKELEEVEKSLTNGRNQINDTSAQLDSSNKQLDNAIADNNQAHSSYLKMEQTLEGLPG